MTTSAGVDVSVVIPFLRVDEALHAQLDALSRQKTALRCEVLLADNAGDARSDELAAAHPNLRLRVVDASAERGTAYARNRGVAAAKAPKVLFCDSDDLVASDWVERGARHLDEVPVFTGGAVPVAADRFDSGYEEVFREIAEEADALRNTSEPAFVRGDYPVLLGCSFGARRDVLDDLGGFDRALRAQGEDNDLAFRIIEHLGELPVRRDVLIAYRLRASKDETFRRGLDAGFKHALVCARHNAFHVSPSFAGHWITRPLAHAVLGLLRREPVADQLGRSVGATAGRAACALGLRIPARLGL